MATNDAKEVAVPTWARVLIGGSLVVLTVAITYSLVSIWPEDGKVAAVSKSVLLGWDWALSGDQHLLVLVILAGTVGGLARSLVQMGKNIGDTDLKWRYVMSYLAFPLIGATLSVALYLVIRAGFVNFDSVSDTNPYGYLALAVLCGIFGDLVLGKLKKVAEAFFVEQAEAEAQPGGDK